MPVSCFCIKTLSISALAITLPTLVFIFPTAAYAEAKRADEARKFPDAMTAGVPSDVALSIYTGPMTISEPGTVIDGKIIDGSLRITASQVVIKNSVITFNDFWGINAEGAQDPIIENNRIEGPGKTVTSNSAILGSGRFIGNDISKVENGITLTDGASTVSGNYIHDLDSAAADPHYDGISVQGRQKGVRIDGNTIVGRNTSDIFINTDFGSVDDVVVSDNLLIGDAGYAIYIYGGDNGYTTTNIVISGNHIEHGGYGFYAIHRADPVFRGNRQYARSRAPAPGSVVPSVEAAARP
jgi:hypothetical protein